MKDDAGNVSLGTLSWLPDNWIMPHFIVCTFFRPVAAISGFVKEENTRYASCFTWYSFIATLDNFISDETIQISLFP